MFIANEVGAPTVVGDRVFQFDEFAPPIVVVDPVTGIRSLVDDDEDYDAVSFHEPRICLSEGPRPTCSRLPCEHRGPEGANPMHQTMNLDSSSAMHQLMLFSANRTPSSFFHALAQLPLDLVHTWILGGHRIRFLCGADVWPTVYAWIIKGGFIEYCEFGKNGDPLVSIFPLRSLQHGVSYVAIDLAVIDVVAPVLWGIPSTQHLGLKLVADLFVKKNQPLTSVLAEATTSNAARLILTHLYRSVAGQSMII